VPLPRLVLGARDCISRAVRQPPASDEGAQKVAWSAKIRQALPPPSHFDVYSEWRKALKAGLPALAREAVASKPGGHENDPDIRPMDEAHIGQKEGRNKVGRSTGSGDAFCATAVTVVFAVSPLPLRCAAQASSPTSKSRRTLRRMSSSCRNPSWPCRQLLASTTNQRVAASMDGADRSFAFRDEN